MRAVTLALLLGANCAAAQTAPTVAIVKSRSLPPLEQAVDAMTDRLRQSPLAPRVSVHDLEGDEKNAPGVLERVRVARPAVVVPVGTLATAVVLAEAAPGPVVFSMVLYPDESGFFSTKTHPMTGVSLDIPLDRQFQTLRQLLPAARRVGVLFNPGETGHIVEAARGVAEGHGFTLDAQEVPQSWTALGRQRELFERVDALWSVADSNVFTPQTTEPLILAALRQQVPLFGLSPAQVRTGALLALSADYADIGAQTAELVLRVLAGESAASIPITVPRAMVLRINLRTAQHLGLFVPPELQQEAVEVIQ